MEILELHWYDHALFFVTAVVIPLLSFMARPLTEETTEEMEVDMELPPKKHLYYQNGLVLIIGALFVVTSWNAANRSWTGLGFQYVHLNTIVKYATIVLVGFYFFDLIKAHLRKNETNQRIQDLQHVIPLNFEEFKHYIFLAFAAGICEEIIFRGFLINYLFTLLQSVNYTIYIAILIPALTFGLSHYYQGLRSVFKIFFVAILFGIIFVWSGSLYLVMAIHVLIDLVSGLSALYLVKKEGENEKL